MRIPSVPALVNRENRGPAFGGDLLDIDLLDDGERWRIDGQRPVKRGHGLGRAFDLDQDAIRVVQDEAGEAQSLRKPVDEGPKADALYRASNAQAYPNAHHRRIVAPRRRAAGRDEVSSLHPSQWMNSREAGGLPTASESGHAALAQGNIGNIQGRAGC
jgi:hypothetical protein